MDKLLEALGGRGVNIQGSLARFIQNESLYVKWMKRFPAETAKDDFAFFAASVSLSGCCQHVPCDEGA